MFLVPPKGLVVYCGTIMTDEGKEKKVTIDFEPFKPINTSLYLCDNKFHTEALSDLLTDDNCFGFIVMDGNGCLFGTLTGNTRDIITKVIHQYIYINITFFLVHSRFAKETRSWWSVCSSFCSFENGKKAQLRAKSCRNRSSIIHFQ